MSWYDNLRNTEVAHTYTTERPLDENFYNPTEDSVSFFKTLTRISDDEELKRHVIAVQTEAYKVRPGLPAIPKIYLTADLPLRDHTIVRFYEVEELLDDLDRSVI
jgi:hypothetical protein